LLFSSRPKDDVRSLFGREAQVRRLRSDIQSNHPLVVITGLRRMGKTSLLRSVLAEHRKRVVWLDMRNLEPKSYATKGDLVDMLGRGVAGLLERNASGREKVLDALRTVRGVRVAGTGVDLGWPDKKDLDMAGLFMNLDRWGGQNGTNVIFSIDEAQELAKARHINMNSIFASVYDNCKNVMLVLTGSEIGLLRDFLALDDPSSPLFGRYVSFIDLGPLSKQQSSEFLKAGFAELGVGLDKDAESGIEAAVSALGGVLGWLNLFGLECAATGNAGAAELEAVREAGSKLAKAEFERFLSTRAAKERYELIMKGMRSGGISWRSLQDFVQLRLGQKVHDKNFCDLLGVLVKAGFVRKQGNLYSIADPLLEIAYR